MPDDLRKAIAEFVGAFALIFVGAGSIVANSLTNGAVGLVGIALAHGLTIGTMVSAVGHISGAHLNPAVTLGFLVTRRITARLSVIYIVSQLLGGIVAALLLNGIFPSSSVSASKLGATLVHGDIGVGMAVLVEIVLTFLLVLVIFGTAVDSRGPKLGGMAIGLVITLAVFVGGPLTGASLNPTRTLGPALVGGYWADHWVYWIGPAVGAVLAALLYHHIFMPKENRE